MFRSFYFPKFEIASSYDERGVWIDQMVATHPGHYVDADDRRLLGVGIPAACEASHEPSVDCQGHSHFPTVLSFLEVARKYRIELIKEFFHRGFATDIEMFSGSCMERFTSYSASVAHFIGSIRNAFRITTIPTVHRKRDCRPKFISPKFPPSSSDNVTSAILASG
jgi:hypothetical protein